MAKPYKPKRKDYPINRLTLRQLIRTTPSEVRARSADCRVISRNYGIGSREGFKRSRPKYPTYYNEMRVMTRCSTEKRYSYIRFYGPPELTTPVWVWCSCEYFAYYIEWVLAKYNSSTISSGYANRGVRILNQPPRVRNPKQIPYMCKHLLRCTELALKETKDYASEAYLEEAES
jgi:hypothetical protein